MNIFKLNKNIFNEKILFIIILFFIIAFCCIQRIENFSYLNFSTIEGELDRHKYDIEKEVKENLDINNFILESAKHAVDISNRYHKLY